MKIFIDTADIQQIRRAYQLGIIDGVTTNPSLIAKEGRNLETVIREICSIVNGPVSAEVISLKYEEMIEEAKHLVKFSKNIVVKIPMCEDGLKAVHKLSQDGIKTNVTLIFSAQQALLAAKAGASFVSPFLGRLDDIGNEGIQIIDDITTIFDIYGIATEVIAASIRNPIHVLQVARVGADIATIPYEVIMKMIRHPLTDQGIEKFLQDYNKVFK